MHSNQILVQVLILFFIISKSMVWNFCQIIFFGFVHMIRYPQVHCCYLGVLKLIKTASQNLKDVRFSRYYFLRDSSLHQYFVVFKNFLTFLIEILIALSFRITFELIFLQEIFSQAVKFSRLLSRILMLINDFFILISRWFRSKKLSLTGLL